MEAQHRLENKGVLSRVEFFSGLVHLAIMKYCHSGESSDVSEALHRLLMEDMAPRASANVTIDPAGFRSKCYARATCEVLISFEPSLRNIFAGVAGGGRQGSGAMLISLDEWLDFLRALGFIATDLSERDARFCFIWSRMHVMDARDDMGYMRDSCLPFEGFLEAMLRVACLKALPTDDELRESGSPHAGKFMASMKLEDEERYEAWLLERASPLSPDPTPSQPIERCAYHTIAMMIHVIEIETKGRDNQRLTEKEVVEWLKFHKIYGYYDDCDND